MTASRICLLAALLPLLGAARVQAVEPRYDLRIGYELPADENLAAAARRKVAEYDEDRNTANQTCQRRDLDECYRNNEIAFREKLGSLPGIKLRLLIERTPPEDPDPGSWLPRLFPLSADEATDPRVDLLLQHARRWGLYTRTGLYADARCTVHRAKDNAAARLAPNVRRAVCSYALLDAIYEGNVAQVKALLDAGIDVNAPFAGKVPLVSAALWQQPEALELLLHHGAEINAVDGEGYNALGFLSGCLGPLACGAIGNHPNGYPPAARQLELLRLLIAKGADVNRGLYRGQSLLEHVLDQSAVSSGADLPLEVVKLLVSHGARTRGGPLLVLALGEKNPFQTRPDACARSKPYLNPSRREAVRYLIDHGADMNAEAFGQTPLGRALCLGDFELATYLVKHGADVNKPDGWRSRPLTYALAHKPPDAATIDLLLRRGAQVDADALGETLDPEDTGMLIRLLRRRVTPKARDGALFEAVRRGSLESVRILVLHGANVNAHPHDGLESDRGLTPLDVARRSHHEEIARFLLAHGGTPGHRRAR